MGIRRHVASLRGMQGHRDPRSTFGAGGRRAKQRQVAPLAHRRRPANKVLQLTVRPVTALAAATAPHRSQFPHRLRSTPGYAGQARAAPVRPAAENNVRLAQIERGPVVKAVGLASLAVAATLLAGSPTPDATCPRLASALDAAGLRELATVASGAEAYRVVMGDHQGARWKSATVVIDEGSTTSAGRPKIDHEGNHCSVVLTETAASDLRELVEDRGLWKGRATVPPEDVYRVVWSYTAVEGVKGNEWVCYEGLAATDLVVYEELHDTLVQLCKGQQDQ